MAPRRECRASITTLVAGAKTHDTVPSGAGVTDTASHLLCPDGPVLVPGDFDVLTPSGEPVPRLHRGVALCRCGASAIKPCRDGP